MRLDPERDRSVEVLHDGRWLPGTLMHAYRRREDGRWRAIVRYTAGVGQRYEQARDQDDIRQVDQVRISDAVPPWPLV